LERLFDPIRPRTLRDEVVTAIREAIIRGKIKPGERLKEGAIAEQMGVSRNPVREALRQLEQEGLVVTHPNQGSFVRVFEEKDIKEIFTLRAGLESLACEMTMDDGGLQPQDISHLESYIERQKDATAACDFDTLTKLDMQFHEFICEKSGCSRLLRMWQSLCPQIELLFHQRFRAMPDKVTPTVFQDHAAIIEFSRQGDVLQLTRLHKEINARVAKECIEILHSRNSRQRP
jgi:DNA-binding GntR family transcriptional regulator